MAKKRQSAARRYAEAAFEIAMRDDTVADWRTDLEVVAAQVADEQVLDVLRNPAIPTEERSQALRGILGDRVSRPVQNLVQLMLRRGRIDELSRVATEFRRLDDGRQGIVHATAVAAQDLTKDEIRALTGRLEQQTGGRVSLDVEVDPSLLGGLVVRVGDRLIDGSVRGRLERLRNQLVSGAL
jgi:F-type H+-transporting ATPase subunit delta